MKDLSAAEIYVDGDHGNDSNNGFSAAESVKTIGKAIEILGTIPSNNDVPLLYIEGGTYTEDVEFLDKQVFVHLDGSVTINGNLKISNCLVHFIQDTTGDLNIATDSSGYNKIEVSNTSNAVFKLPVNISGVCSNAVCVDFSYCRFGENVSISSNGQGVTANHSAFIYFTKNLSISGNGVSKCIQSFSCSDVTINGNINISAQDVGILAENGGNIYILSQTITINYGNIGVFATKSGVVNILDFTTFTLNRANRYGSCFRSTRLGYIYVETERTSSALNINMGSVSNGYCVQNWEAGNTVLNAKTINYSGAVDVNCILDENSYCSVASGAQITGSLTGVRYLIRWGSILATNGGGANRLPGSAAGGIETYSIYI